ncbi:MAG: hypothetical protein OXN84_10260 [Albidovulum sp.]|nr:hypothetical protein [Albidovulum sp.]
MDRSGNRMRHFHAHRGGKLALLDHVQITTYDVQAAYEWYSAIGFRLTEYTAADGTDELWGVRLKRTDSAQDADFSTAWGRGCTTWRFIRLRSRT